MQLNCEKHYCIANLEGRCVHNTCPMQNPNYITPAKVAERMEKEMRQREEVIKQMEYTEHLNEYMRTKRMKKKLNLD